MINRHMKNYSTSQISRKIQINATMRLTLDTCQDGYYQENKTQVLAIMWRNWNPCTLLVGVQNGAAIIKTVKR